MLLLLIVAGLIVVCITTLILYARWNFGILESLKLPVIPNPHYILGTTRDSHRVVNGLRDIQWMKEYGCVYGVYEGRQAQIHVSDGKMIRKILVKDYAHFSDRRVQDFGSPLLDEMPDFLSGEKWKIVRQFITPTFSSGKIKHMNESMNSCLADYVRELKAKAQMADTKRGRGRLEHYNLKRGIFNMMTDMILRCVFSIKIGDRDGNSDHFVRILKQLLGSEEEGTAPKPNFMSSLALSFPFIKTFTVQPLFNSTAANNFVTTFKELMSARVLSGVQYNDFTDQVIAIMKKVGSPEFNEAKISEITIMCQVLVFFFAGQDPISHIASLLIYHLSRDSAVEERVRQEVDLVFEEDRSGDGEYRLEHESLSKLPYLSACITETLRLYPFFIRIERVCTKACDLDLAHEEGHRKIRINKGQVILIPTWAANRNPDYFDHPEVFNPERFMPANKAQLKSYAFTTFGSGPRNCVGQRFSMEALLISTAYLYRHFQLKLTDEFKLEFEPGSLVFGTAKSIYVDVYERD